MKNKCKHQAKDIEYLPSWFSSDDDALWCSKCGALKVGKYWRSPYSYTPKKKVKK